MSEAAWASKLWSMPACISHAPPPAMRISATIPTTIRHRMPRARGAELVRERAQPGLWHAGDRSLCSCHEGSRQDAQERSDE